ncbi:MAG: hypothetical protein ACW990_10840 [Promethearchaeota archaeon]|jgi:proteasome lid subunit RPN8/RPN11
MGKNDDQHIVTIRPLAYYKMLLHVLRFGSKYLDHSKLSEVMGVLIGKLEGEGEIKDVIVEDVVPVSHGGTIEVKFSVDQLGAFGELDSKIWEQYGDLGWFSVGWYHSHPGLGIFFSETDKFNQIFWQKNPSGIGIVFDHTYLDKPEGDVGFRIFRLDETNLDDPSVAMKSNYHEVKAIVDPPNSLEFYMKLMELINNVHTGSPQILELNETIDLFGDIFIPEEEQVIAKIPEINSEEIISTLKDGMERFVEMSMRPLIYLLNSWGQTTVSKIATNNSRMRLDLKDLRDNLSSEIINLQQTFNYDLQNELRDLDFYVDDKLEDLDKEQNDIRTLVKHSKGDFEIQIEKRFTEKTQSLVTPIINELDTISTNLSEFNKQFITHFENQKSGITRLSSIIENYKSVDNFIKSSLSTVQDDFFTKFVKKISKMKGNLNNFDKETKTYLSNLKAAIILLEGSKNPIKSKINTLQDENKELRKSIKELKNEKQQLLSQIKKLEKGGG